MQVRDATRVTGVAAQADWIPGADFVANRHERAMQREVAVQSKCPVAMRNRNEVRVVGGEVAVLVAVNGSFDNP